MSTITVAGLEIYPIKSLGGVSLPLLSLDAMGAMNDRRYMLIDSTNTFLTQRECAAMATLRISQVKKSAYLIAGNNNETWTFDYTSAQLGEEITATIWDDQVSVRPVLGEVNDWLANYLKQPCQLVTLSDTYRRPVDQQFGRSKDQVSLADGFPFLLTSLSSLAEFNEKLDSPILMHRFRPNIVIDGCEPYAEDHWKRLRIGGIDFEVVKPCCRCQIPAIDIHTGEKQVEVSRALAKYRRRGDQVYFGQNLIHRAAGSISLGDFVEVLD
jgi:uncharacterized protein YcbX